MAQADDPNPGRPVNDGFQQRGQGVRQQRGQDVVHGVSPSEPRREGGGRPRVGQKGCPAAVPTLPLCRGQKRRNETTIYFNPYSPRILQKVSARQRWCVPVEARTEKFSPDFRFCRLKDFPFSLRL